MTLSELKTIVDLLVMEGCGECDLFKTINYEDLELREVEDPEQRAKLVKFLKENFN